MYYYYVQPDELRSICHIPRLIHKLIYYNTTAISVNNCSIINHGNSDFNLKLLLFRLIKTNVIAINLGENDWIEFAKPCEAIMYHLKRGGKIRRYYIESNIISKQQRRDSGLFTAFKEERLKDKEDPNRIEAKWLRLNDAEWAAIKQSNARMGEKYISQFSAESLYYSLDAGSIDSGISGISMDM